MIVGGSHHQMIGQLPAGGWPTSFVGMRTKLHAAFLLRTRRAW